MPPASQPASQPTNKQTSRTGSATDSPLLPPCLDSVHSLGAAQPWGAGRQELDFKPAAQWREGEGSAGPHSEWKTYSQHSHTANTVTLLQPSSRQCGRAFSLTGAGQEGEGARPTDPTATHLPSWLGPCHRLRATTTQGARLQSPGCPGAKPPPRNSAVLLSTHKSSFLHRWAGTQHSCHPEVRCSSSAHAAHTAAQRCLPTRRRLSPAWAKSALSQQTPHCTRSMLAYSLPTSAALT